MTTALSPSKPFDHMYYVAASGFDEGARFELSIQSFLQTAPAWSEQRPDVWLSEDGPSNIGHEIDIELAARRYAMVETDRSSSSTETSKRVPIWISSSGSAFGLTCVGLGYAG